MAGQGGSLSQARDQSVEYIYICTYKYVYSK